MEFKTIADYQKETHKTCLPECFNERYLTAGVVSEVGEIGSILKREVREGYTRKGTSQLAVRGRVAYNKELGDVAWYLSELILLRGFDIPSTLSSMDKAAEGIKAEDINETSHFLKVNLLCAMIALDSGEYVQEEYFQAWWEIVLLARANGTTLQNVLSLNVEKLRDRQQRNKIQGKGDNR